MSRKSKRRRMRLQVEHAQAGREAAESFEFLDDRGALAPASAAPAEGAAPVHVALPASSDRTEPVATQRVAEPTPASPGAGESTQRVAAADTPVVAAAPQEPVRTLGEILTEARETSGLSLEEASARTRISAKMLGYLENDQFGEFAAEAYARGSLRAYGGFLGLDVGMLLARYEAMRGHAAEPAAQPVWEPVVEPAMPPVVTRMHRPRDVRRLVLGGVAVLVMVAVAAGVFLVRSGVVQLRPEAGLTQIENELRETRAPDSTAHVAVAPMAVDSAPSLAQPSDVGPPAVALHEDTAPPAAAPRAALPPPATLPPPAPTTLVASREATMPTRASTPPPRVTVPPARETAASMTDLTEETLPNEVTETVAAPRLDPLVLTAAARDTCSLRLQIDTADGRTVQIHLQPGEARSWTARESFRIAARRGSKVDLWLNGRPVTIPSDGRPLRVDRGNVQALTTDQQNGVRSSGGRGSRKSRRAAGRGAVQSPAAAAGPSRAPVPGPLP
jgi:cytoskeleton protein RodZ